MKISLEKLFDQYNILQINTMALFQKLEKYKFENRITTSKNILITLLNHISDKIQLLNPKRTKRGLINGLGSIINSITGNLDASDKERYDHIIQNLDNNEKLLSTKINSLVKINNNITAQFNDKINIINENNNVLNSKLNNIEKEIGRVLEELEILKVQNLVNEFIQVGQDIYFSLIQIEETLTFCRLNILHFGIINHEQLLKEINKIEDRYVRSILVNNVQNSNILKTYCSYENPNLNILIEIPSNTQVEDIIQVTSIPTGLHNIYETVNVINGLYSKNNCKIKLLNKCNQVSRNEYYCLSQNNEYNKCLENIICYKDFQFCDYNEISLINSVIKIKNSNLNYLYFPNKKRTKYNCNNKINVQELHGIYYTENCIVNDKIELINKFGPLININHNITNSQIKHLENKIKNITELKIKTENDIQLDSIYSNSISNKIHNILIYVILIIIIIICILYFLKCKGYLKQIKNLNKSKKAETKANPSTSLQDIAFSKGGGDI